MTEPTSPKFLFVKVKAAKQLKKVQVGMMTSSN